MKNRLALFVCVLSLLVSCKVPKDVTYFQGIKNLSAEQLKAMSQTYHTTICPDDLLTITVTAWDPNVTTPFNPPTYAYSTILEGEVTVQASPSMYTYPVDQDGNIDFPVLGKMHVQGLTRTELAEKLRKDISGYIEDPIVKVQIVNFKVTMLGEFNRPGIVNVRTDRLSILDAIGYAGELSINANRKSIMIMRDNDGEPECGWIDMTDPAVFASPFFYLKQNDLVYVEPNDAKKRNANYSSGQQYNITVFSSIISALSLITSVVIALTK